MAAAWHVIIQLRSKVGQLTRSSLQKRRLPKTQSDVLSPSDENSTTNSEGLFRATTAQMALVPLPEWLRLADTVVLRAQSFVAVSAPPDFPRVIVILIPAVHFKICCSRP